MIEMILNEIVGARRVEKKGVKLNFTKGREAIKLWKC